MIDGDWLTRKEAARYLTKLGVPTTPKRLEHLAINNNSGKGPPYTKFGWRSVFYQIRDLEAWAEWAKENGAVETVR